jgi:hypothetical protein
MIQKIVSIDVFLLNYLQSFVDQKNNFEVELIKIFCDFEIIIVVFILV